ncbi:MAG: hypothetical protein BWX89_00021 [candidate division TA06 bacterium ADurb.Bin131]|uniref:Uncharacterized protein n=1 Tax=candidate division TA06 bacterium ADurb.Bin131 TaxID=1852827 RepID=A0A1V6CF37_UNCT6|nr:MAG: hypothetical protein BWX89_00021 [candidate division TA06 bacterium ADurb.Bin131]
MATNSNLVKLEWKQFPNNLITVDGFYAEYMAKDYAEMDKTKQETGTENIETDSEKIFYDRNSQQIILRPDILPIDMLGEVVKEKRIIMGTEKEVNVVKGDWWDLYDSLDDKKNYIYSGYADFELRAIAGTPKRQMIYQKAVQYRKDLGFPYTATKWILYGGIKDEKLNENQGIVFWINENMLPENEENELYLYLWHPNPHNDKQPINGIYISLKGDSDIKIQHFIDIIDEGKIPPYREVLTQSEQGTVSAGKDVVEWAGKTKVYVLMIQDRFIQFGINGLDNPFVMECQNYDIGITPEGITYPVILREGARLMISGKGQALFGVKKLSFSKEGKIKTPEFNTGYVLSDPEQITRGKRDNNSEIKSKWMKKGNSADEYKVYAEIKLEGSPMPGFLSENNEVAQRLNEYRKEHTEKSPAFLKTKIIDKQQRDIEEIELPSNIEGTIINYNETVSANENGTINDYSITLDCFGTFENMYSDVITKKLLHGEVFIKLKGQETSMSVGGYIFKAPMIKINNFENISLSLEGKETALFSLSKNAGYIISFDDRKITDVDAMKEISNINNLYFYTDVEGVRLPDTVEGKEGTFTFQPNVSFLEILTKLAEVQGYNLFTDEGNVYYKKEKTTADITLGRDPIAPCENIEYEHNDIFKSRIYVMGRAGENTSEYKRYEKLVGIWKSKTIEKEIGYDTFVKEDESLTDWDKIQKEGQKLWKRFNERNYIIKFDITDASDYFDKIKLFNTFKWIDSEYSFLDQKLFQIIGYSKDVGMIDCTATITGLIL